MNKMISQIVRSCRSLQRPLYAQFLNQTVCYRAFHSTPYKSTHQQIPQGNLWTWQWWHRFWRTWAPVPTLFGITILIVWQYSRRLQHRYINDECSTASQLEIQCYRSIPLRFLSRSWGKLSQLYIPVHFRRFFYLTFAKTYGINLDEVKEDLESYQSLGEFFIRHLRHGVRPISLEELVSPADGTVLNCGRVTSCCVEQVKGTTYLIRSFLGENTWSDRSTSHKSTNTPLVINYMSKPELHQDYFQPISIQPLEKLLQPLEKEDEYFQPLNIHPVEKECQDYLNLLSQDILGVLENKSQILGVLENKSQLLGVLESKDDKLEKHYVKGKSKETRYLIELPVVPSLLDYYVREVVQSVYSSVSLLLYRGNLAMSSPEYYGVASSGSAKSPICTPSAEEEWSQYKRHLLHNPQDNELYQLIVYLAPGDYHRFHSPAEAHIKYRRHFQGDLLSVNPCVACWIPDLFVLNERAAYMGEWQHGFFSMTMVGATNVGSIKVHCDETLLTNSKRWPKGIRHKDLPLNTAWAKGQEVGEFRMGSTVVLLFEAPRDFQFNVTGGDKIKVGQSLVRK